MAPGARVRRGVLVGLIAAQLAVTLRDDRASCGRIVPSPVWRGGGEGVSGPFIRSERWSVHFLLLLPLLLLPVLILLLWWLREKEGHQRLQGAALFLILLNVLLNELPQLFYNFLFWLVGFVLLIALPS